jgi:hypothetical protein
MVPTAAAPAPPPPPQVGWLLAGLEVLGAEHDDLPLPEAGDGVPDILQVGGALRVHACARLRACVIVEMGGCVGARICCMRAHVCVSLCLLLPSTSSTGRHAHHQLAPWPIPCHPFPPPPQPPPPPLHPPPPQIVSHELQYLEGMQDADGGVYCVVKPNTQYVRARRGGG